MASAIIITKEAPGKIGSLVEGCIEEAKKALGCYGDDASYLWLTGLLTRNWPPTFSSDGSQI